MTESDNNGAGRGPRRRKRRIATVAVVVALLAAAGFAFKQYRHNIFMDNFGVVEPGRIFRSGQLTARQLEKLIAGKGIRTVLNLRDESESTPVMREESEVCLREGVRLIVIPMPGDGLADFEQLDQAFEGISDTNNYPLLVHCARGSYRTGAVVGAYRAAICGWPMERILDEMREHRFTSRDDHPLIGHLEKYLQTLPQSPPQTPPAGH